ncbi:MAG: hypothetical protein CMN55_13315 [Sneathiella sp.]|jgi:hypothetical protein|uniref:DUF6898 family protein n=1 Tax=Sneathiella sp. TaxID=1964365 RepID=UPI000C361C64|nr:hypothetical protein [Sneathiella sp.]MAL80068.1 hypothetical protein [Sneathiella sp.]|tara:strand:+ start:129 stop:386 length:258 start_codon:yes stop_codon:yes gene_type:complete
MTADRDMEGYIIEYQAHGVSVKVSLFDPATMTEVSIVGAASASRAELERAVIARLAYVLKREAGETADADEKRGQTAQKKPGIIV